MWDDYLMSIKNADLEESKAFQVRKDSRGKVKNYITDKLPDLGFTNDDDATYIGVGNAKLFNGFKEFADASLQLARSQENRTLQHNAVIEFIFQTRKIVKELEAKNTTAFEKKACAELIKSLMNKNKINSSLVHSLEDKEALEEISIEVNNLSQIEMNETDKKNYEEYEEVSNLGYILNYAHQHKNCIPSINQTEVYENNSVIYSDNTDDKRYAIGKFEEKFQNPDYEKKFNAFLEEKKSRSPNGHSFWFVFLPPASLMAIAFVLYFLQLMPKSGLIPFLIAAYFSFKLVRSNQKKSKDNPREYYKNNWDYDEIKIERKRLKDAIDKTGVTDDDHVQTIKHNSPIILQVQRVLKEKLSKVVPTLYSDHKSIFFNEDLNKLEEITKVKSEKFLKDFSILSKILP